MPDKPKPQIARVIPATEGEKVGPKKYRPTRYEPSRTPVRCQIWDHRRLVGTVPITFDDMGHPTDVTFTPTSVEKVTRLAFVYGGNVFAYPISCRKSHHPDGEPCGEEVIISPGNPLHLALGHLKLRDKFGNVVLQAGK